MKINDIIELSSAFSAEVNVARDFDYSLTGENRFLNGYLPNASSRIIIKEIFNTLPSREDRKLHLITASYGTGKSYLLLMLGFLLSGAKSSVYTEFIKKINDKQDSYNDELSTALQNYLSTSSKYLIVVPNYGTEDFDQALLSALNESLLSNGIPFRPRTYYFRAADTLENWKTENQDLFKKFEEKIVGKTGDDFIRLLKECDGSAYLIFKEKYKEIVFSEFSETHGNVYEAFSETAQKILEIDYKGIVILYDEFGGVLDKLINKSSQTSSLKIQEFIERLKDRKVNNANLIFVAASHQDPTTIQEDKQKNIDKIVGRFERHRLEVADSESEELMGKVFITKDQAKKNALLSNVHIVEQFENIENYQLYPYKSEEWINNKIIKDLYPLHPLTSFILPRLSNQFAQNTRSMFNFLSPNEIRDGSLKKFIDNYSTTDINSKKLTIFTPDMLLVFFLKNLSDAKSEIIAGIIDSYQTTIGRFNDPVIIQLMQNILVLTATRKEQVLPTFQILEWAMHNINSTDLKFLLDGLVQNETLEFNQNLQTYEFPAFNSKSLSKILKEVEANINQPNLAQCKNIWSELFDQPLHFFEGHNSRYGCNRNFKYLPVSDVDELERNLDHLKKFYNWELKDITAQGYIIQLLIDDENEIESFQRKVESYPDLKKYLVFAVPNDFNQFEQLKKKTFEFIVSNKTSQHQEVIANVNHVNRIKTELSRHRSELTRQIRELYEQPQNWFWSFAELSSGIEIKNARTLDHKLEELVDSLFTVVPKINDNALWFSKFKPNESIAVIEEIITPDKDKIPVINNNNQSVVSRVIERFFQNLGITKETKLHNKIQYAEIKVPDAGTPADQIFKLFNKNLKVGNLTAPEDFVKPLLNSPYGLSDQLIKMFFASFIRANQENISIVDARKPMIIFDKDPTTIENIFKKNGTFAIRKMEMTIFELKYLRQLNNLFQNQTTTSSFGDLSKRFDGLVRFLSIMNIAHIEQHEEIKRFYDILSAFLDRAADKNVDREKVSKEFFMQTLPEALLDLNISEFENDDDNILKIIGLIKGYKNFPLSQETTYKREVILNLSTKVFRIDISSPDDFKKVVKDWFDKLNTATRRIAAFEDDKITMWLKALRNDDITDVLKFYLEELSLLPIKDWKDLALEQFTFISQIEKHKKDIEDYKASPLAHYQSIARACFSMSANDCSTEQIFSATFKDWWNQLPQITRGATFEDEYINIFMTEMNSSFNTREKFLVNIPIKWRDNGFDWLINTDWENWSPTESREICNQYEICVRTISDWRPPIEETTLFEKIGKLFSESTTFNSSTLETFLSNEWYVALPENTREAHFSSGSAELEFLNAIKSKNSKNLFLIDLPKLLNYKEFRYWNEILLSEYIDKIKSIKRNIEEYKRPLMEFIEEFEKKKSHKSYSVNEFIMRFKSTLENLEVFRTTAGAEPGLVEENALLLMKLTRELNVESDFQQLISEIGKLFLSRNDYALWSSKEQTTIIKELNTIVKYLEDWRYPSDEQMQIAKDSILDSIGKLKKEMNLSKSQILKILDDLIHENFGNSI